MFENSFLKNGVLEFWSKALIASILTYSSNDNEVHNQNMISTKVVFTNFCRKRTKIFIFDVLENSDDEKC